MKLSAGIERMLWRQKRPTAI